MKLEVKIGNLSLQDLHKIERLQMLDKDVSQNTKDH
jgi:hypothetical protein